MAAHVSASRPMSVSATRYTPIDAPASIADAIRIRGARQNNLRNLSLDLPLNRLTVSEGRALSPLDAGTRHAVVGADLFRSQLIAEGLITKDEFDRMKADWRARLESGSSRGLSYSPIGVAAVYPEGQRLGIGELAPFLATDDPALALGPRARAFLAELPSAGDAVELVVAINRRIAERVRYVPQVLEANLALALERHDMAKEIAGIATDLLARYNG